MRLADLTIPAQPEFVSVARMVVSSVVADRFELEDEQLDDLKLAVSEACTASMGSSRNPSINLVAESFTDHFTVFVSSPEGKFDEELLEGDMLMEGSPAQIDDLGLPLISTLVDELTIQPGPNGDGLLMKIFSTEDA